LLFHGLPNQHFLVGVVVFVKLNQCLGLLGSRGGYFLYLVFQVDAAGVALLADQALLHVFSREELFDLLLVELPSLSRALGLGFLAVEKYDGLLH
jgi:hypothetical protein